MYCPGAREASRDLVEDGVGVAVGVSAWSGLKVGTGETGNTVAVGAASDVGGTAVSMAASLDAEGATERVGMWV